MTTPSDMIRLSSDSEYNPLIPNGARSPRSYHVNELSRLEKGRDYGKKKALILLVGLLLLTACDKTSKLDAPPATKEISKNCEYLNLEPQTFISSSAICKIRYSGDSKRCIDYLDHFYKDKSKIPVLINYYIQLWKDQFDKLINGSSITLFQGPEPDNKSLLENKIDMSKAASKGIKYTPRDSSFGYKTGIAYANFANERWGGDVLGGANVQEEIQMRQSNALVWIAQEKSARSNHVEWCPSININNLAKNPVVMAISLFLDFDNSKGYGSMLDSLSVEEQKSLLTAKEKREDIYSFAMAAPYFSQGSSYTQKDLEDMYLVATKAFYYTMLLMENDKKAIEIHTGNWGAGVFNHSVKMSWAIQYLAIRNAYELFKINNKNAPKIEYIYNTFNQHSLNKILEATTESMQIFNKNLSPAEYIGDLIKLANNDSSWQVRK